MKLSGFVGSSMADPVFNITGFKEVSEVMGFDIRGCAFSRNLSTPSSGETICLSKKIMRCKNTHLLYHHAKYGGTPTLHAYGIV